MSDDLHLYYGWQTDDTGSLALAAIRAGDAMDAAEALVEKLDLQACARVTVVPAMFASGFLVERDGTLTPDEL